MAGAIKGWHKKDSLVIALYGQWGSGKTLLEGLLIKIQLLKIMLSHFPFATSDE